MDAGNSIFDELAFHPGEGALRFKGVRYLLIRPETLASFQLAMEAEIGPERAGELVYVGGFTGGQLSGRKYKEALGLSDREAVEFMCRMGGEIGWGNFNLVELDSAARRLVVEVNHSPFAEAYRQLTENPQNRKGSCHLIRGVLGGLAAGVFDAAVQARETNCFAQGDARCRFEIQALN